MVRCDGPRGFRGLQLVSHDAQRNVSLSDCGGVFSAFAKTKFADPNEIPEPIRPSRIYSRIDSKNWFTDWFFSLFSRPDEKLMTLGVIGTQLLTVKGIMVKNRPNICIADKSVKFCWNVRFGLLIKKKYGPREIQTLTLAKWCHIGGGWRGGILRILVTFYQVDKIAQNFVYIRKIKKIKIPCWRCSLYLLLFSNKYAS